MNRIYKVIWNNARGMYVVTSELAKNHSGHKSRVSRGGKWLAALTLAIGLSVALFKAGPGALAATTTGAGEGNIVGQVITTNSEISGDHVATRALGTYATVTGGYLNDANGNYSTVSGGNSNIANGQYSGIYGGYHNITGSNNDNNSGLYAAILGGYENTATGMEATAVGGYKGSASGQYSTAIGGGSAQGDYSIAIGKGSVATAENQISFGDASDTSKNHQLKNIADGTDAHDAASVGQMNTALSSKANTSDVYTKTETDNKITAAKPIVGSVNTSGYSTAPGEDSTVTGGEGNTASGIQSSVAGGYYNTAGNRYTFAAGGQNNIAGGEESVVIGGSRNQAGIWKPGTPTYDASGSHSLVAGGQENLAEGSFSVILGGENNYTEGVFSVAVGGKNNSVSHTNAVALGGQYSTVAGAYSASLGGRGSTVAGHWSVGIGGGSTTSTATDAVAIGKGSVATEEGQISFGNAANGTYNRLTNVADGEADHDAATYGQLKATSGRITGIENRIIHTEQTMDALDSRVTNTERSIGALDGRVSKLDSRINRVGAGAAALASLHPLEYDPGDKWNFAVGYGNYRNANATAIGAFYRPNGDTMFSIGGSFGGGENMLNAGVSFKFGRGSDYAGLSRGELLKRLTSQSEEMKELKAQNEAQNERIEKLEAMVEQLLQKGK